MGLLDKIFRRRPAGPDCSAVIAAAGSSRRMEGENKLLLPVGGIPVLAKTLLAFENAPSVGEIVVAVREEDLLTVGDLCKSFGLTKPVKLIKGGEDRLSSVLLAALECDPDSPLLAVHDGARPLVSVELIERVIAKARQCAAAAAAIPVKDTIKVAGADGVVQSTPDRETLRAVQTPQAFDSQLLRAALQSAKDASVSLTDDCAAVERLGKAVALVEGEETNLKITTPLDLLVAEAILEERGELG